MRLLWAIAIACAVAAIAQETPPFRLGIHAGLNGNVHNPAFPSPQPTTEPYYNSSAFGITGAAGLIAHFPVSQNVALGLRGVYGSWGNTTLETTLNGTTWKISPSLPYLELTPTIGIRDLIISRALWLWGGIELGFPLSPSYQLDSGAVTLRTNEALPDPSTRVALAVGAGYDIALSDRWTLQPELSLRFPLTKVSTNSQFDSWSIFQVRLGLNLFYSFGSHTETPSSSPTEPYVRGRISRVVTITPEGDTADVRTIRLEDVRYTEYFPLVPYVFFPANSDKPDRVYVTQTREAGETQGIDTLKDAIAINTYLLPLLCQRMKQYPTARLTIIGTNDGRGEQRDRTLSLRRAQQIRAQLIACGIDSSRISVQARDLPEKPSAPNDPDGMAENRRVEFVASTPELLEPFQSRVRTERLASPDVVLFVPDVSSSDPIKQWELTITQAGRTLRTFRGEGSPRPVTWTIQPSELSSQQVPIDYVYRVESVLGKVSESSGSIGVDYLSSVRTVQERTKDKTVEKFSLILFDFDSDVITPDNRRILDLKILPAIKPNSTVTIYGYTDRIGDARYNLNLSRRRAQAVMEYLKARRPEVTYRTAGFGESVERFDNNSPIGRQLSRTVQIIIETPNM